MIQFSRYELRTTDADAARAFYASILGHDRAVIWPLHEQALARGARPHWLGHLGVEDVERAAAAFVERGAMQLGPILPTRDGGQVVVLRDPGGALVAVATPPPANAEARVDVAWHVLNTNDVARATANYRELFGWEFTDRIDLGAHGVFQQFAWHAGGAAVGAIADIAARPGVHPHWSFSFEVDVLEEAMAAARAAGGAVLDPIVLPSGERVCVCADPQGAAFALTERRRLA
jgi:predicted enzyme related to lactoylglutathione lyase